MTETAATMEPGLSVGGKTSRQRPEPAYTTRGGRGRMFVGLAEAVLAQYPVTLRRGHVQLVFTSPPFPLNRKKRYGNFKGQAYISWLASFAPILKDYLAPRGSIVIEMGNAWVPGEPVMSTLALKALLAFQEASGLHLCQEFICYNPARLPGPAQWVTVERIRVKDSYTRLWWMSPTPGPKANNRRVLREYSSSMLDLLRKGRYNSGRRPSEHVIGEQSFFKDNGGAIPPNVLTVSNTVAGDDYQRYCRRLGVTPHPSRMPMEVAEFFIKFLTDPDDLVLDPFAGSNVTGAAAEKLGRRWISIEAVPEYVTASKGRFAVFSADGAR